MTDEKMHAMPSSLSEAAAFTPLRFSPTEDGYNSNPFPFLANARKEQPVFFSPEYQMWVITRYDDLLTVLKDPRRFSSRQALFLPGRFTPEVQQILHTAIFSTEAGTLVMSDPPTHSRPRHLLIDAFSARNISSLEPEIRELANRLADTFEPGKTVDFAANFAHPLPVQVTCRLLGIPDTDSPKLSKWCDDLSELVDLPLSPEEQLRHAQSCIELNEYISHLLKLRQQTPRNDLASALLQVVEQEQAKLSIQELVELLIVLLNAGFETTMHFLTNLLLRLLSNPPAWENVGNDPQQIGRLIEEGLRLSAPVMGIMRRTTEDVRLGEVIIPANSAVYVMTSSANRDECPFHEPEKFDLQRENSNRHLAFGYGAHLCVGAPLARLESRVSLQVLRQRFPHLRLVENQSITYKPGLILRGMKQLLVTLD